MYNLCCDVIKFWLGYYVLVLDMEIVKVRVMFDVNVWGVLEVI